MKKIQITAPWASTSQYGQLYQGDILNCGDELAKHLVEDAGAAKYLTAADEKPSVEPKVDRVKIKSKE